MKESRSKTVSVVTHFCQQVACMTCPQLPVWVPTASSGGMKRGYEVPVPLRGQHSQHVIILVELHQLRDGNNLSFETDHLLC